MTFPSVRMLVSKDDGSVLLLGMGLAVVALMCATLAINIASAWVVRTHLDSVAETCAIAGAQAVDTSTLYEGIELTELTPTLPQARFAVQRCLGRVGSSHSISVKTITVAGNRVTVELDSRAELPFGYLLGNRSMIVSARASAIHTWSSD